LSEKERKTERKGEREREKDSKHLSRYVVTIKIMCIEEVGN